MTTLASVTLATVTLVTPWAALAGLAAIVPVAAFLVARRRSRTVCRAVGLVPARRTRGPLALGALVLAVGLLALAAAQPVVASHDRSTVRRDADVFLVVDTSRSMLAAPRPGAPTRFDRAIALARTLRDATPTAAFGIASMTDRVLPHLFPTQDRADFDVTLRQAIGVQKPPPAENVGGIGTALESLGDLANARFFDRDAQTRIAVVLTDGESRDFPVERTAAALRRARIQTVLIRIGASGERVFRPNGKSESYRPDRAAGVALARYAAGLGAAAFDERQARAAVAKLSREVAQGRGVSPQESTSVRSLAPYLALAALLPLAFLLWRRNLV